MTEKPKTAPAGFWYWPLTTACLAVGVMATYGVLVIGLLFLFVGLMLLALAPVRRSMRRARTRLR